MVVVLFHFPLFYLLQLFRFEFQLKMASITCFHQFSCKIVRGTVQNYQLKPKIAKFPVNFTNFGVKKGGQRAVSVKKLTEGKPEFLVRVAAEDEWGPEPSSSSGLAVAEEEPPKEPTEIEVLKKQLVDSFYGTNLGLTASSETRAEVVELITQLEAKNPTPVPTEALSLLNGKWILA